MFTRRNLLAGTSFVVAAGSLPRNAVAEELLPVPHGVFPVAYTDQEWRRMLTPRQFHIMREGSTEPEYSDPKWKSVGSGIYQCVGCGQALASSHTLFDAGIGYPNYWSSPPAALDTILLQAGPPRVSVVHCTRCGSHHGHLFPDGPQPTGQRFCLNGSCLNFTAV